MNLIYSLEQLNQCSTAKWCSQSRIGVGCKSITYSWISPELSRCWLKFEEMHFIVRCAEFINSQWWSTAEVKSWVETYWVAASVCQSWIWIHLEMLSKLFESNLNRGQPGSMWIVNLGKGQFVHLCMKAILTQLLMVSIFTKHIEQQNVSEIKCKN